jgi:hypothetical protein
MYRRRNINRNNLAPRGAYPRSTYRRSIPGFQRRGILNTSRQFGRFVINDVWDVSGPTINQAGVSLPIGPSPVSYPGSKYVIDASTYNMHFTSNVFVEFIPAQNRFNAKNQIAAWVSSDPDASIPGTDEAIRQQCMASKGFIWHSEFTFRQNLHVPPSLYKNFSTGNGDSAAGTAFQPQGRIFIVPLKGTDTTEWTYGITNIKFQTRLSGPGTAIAPTTIAIPDDPFAFNVVHDISSWAVASKHAIHTHYLDLSAPRYLSTWEEAPLTPQRAVVYVYDADLMQYGDDVITRYPPNEDRWAYWKSSTSLPLNAVQYYHYAEVEDTGEYSWQVFDPVAGDLVTFTPGTVVNVTTETKTGKHFQLHNNLIDANNVPMITKDENGNNVLATGDSYLRSDLEEFRNLFDKATASLKEILGDIQNEIQTTSDETNNNLNELLAKPIPVEINGDVPVTIQGQPISVTETGDTASDILGFVGDIAGLII